MSHAETNDHFTVLENRAIGRNIARFRKFREKKALEVAEHIGIGEAAYTKYERGESKLTVDFIQNVAEFLDIDPISLMTLSQGHNIENVTNSPFAIDGSTVTTTSEKQNDAILVLIDNVVEMNKRIMDLLEKTGRTGN